MQLLSPFSEGFCTTTMRRERNPNQAQIFVQSPPRMAHLTPDVLQETNMLVDKMQRELNDLQPILEEKTVNAKALLVQVDMGSRMSI